jgi:hypothetical protein
LIQDIQMMSAPAVTSTGAAQAAEPMIVTEPEKKSAEKRSHDNLDDLEVDAAAKRGAAAQLQPTAVIPAPAQEIFPVPPDAGVEQRAEPTIIVNIPSTQRNLLDELQGIDMSSSAFPQPPQQALQLQLALFFVSFENLKYFKPNFNSYFTRFTNLFHRISLKF